MATAPAPAPTPPEGWQVKPDVWPPATGCWEYDPATGFVREIPQTRLSAPDEEAE